MLKLINGDVALRKFVYDDIYRMAELANNLNIAVNLRDGFPNPYTISDAEKFVNNISVQENTLALAIEYKDNYVGNIALIKGRDVYRKSAEIGYFLGEPYWNKGIMSKAVHLICDYGFANLDIVRIYAGIFEYNHASMRVLEKCGFKREAIHEKAVFKQGIIWNEIVYAKLKPENS